ncbi:WD repeat-containing protein 48-like isoform X1 [Carex littledalei]|uniref:WD repeat-containing protein 48-like isoform X1 n=1 Tax=Carex littledalei TaxID=544730 RepID=A0A833VTW6_9POAL|nr:WD repeat-containing protein 48-like isoform X1 [Carex littledalei]
MHRVGSAGNTASSTRPRKEKRFTYVLNDADDTKHCAGINCLAYLKASTSDSCDYLFSGSRDGTLKRWALKDQNPTFSGTFESHVDWVNDAIIAGDSLVSCSSDATIKAWNCLSDGVCTRTFRQHSDYVTCLAGAEKNKNMVASGALGGEVFIWDIEAALSPVIKSRDAVPEDENMTNGNLGAPMSSSRVVSSTNNITGSNNHVNPNGYSPISAKGHKDSVYALAMNDAGTILVSGGTEKVVRVWDPRTGSKNMKLRGHTDNIRALLIDSTGRYCLSGSSDSMIRLWDLGQQRCVHSYAVHTDSVWALAATSSFTHVYSGGRDQSLYLTDLSTRESILLCNNEHPILQLALQDDTIWVATTDSSVYGWPAEGQAPHKVFQKGGSFLAGNLSFSRARASLEGSAPVPVYKEPSFTIPGHPAIIKHEILNNRRHVLTKDTAGSVKLWDITKGVVIEDYGKVTFEEKKEELFERVSIPAWFTMDTRMGCLSVHLDMPQCFSAEMYATDLNLSGFNEDAKINLAHETLKGLLYHWLTKRKPKSGGSAIHNLSNGSDGVVGKFSSTDPAVRNVPLMRVESSDADVADHSQLNSSTYSVFDFLTDSPPSIITEGAHSGPWRKKCVDLDGTEDDRDLPWWCIECVVSGRYPKENTKCSFYLQPLEGSPVPSVTQGKLSAPRILRIHKVVNYVVEKFLLDKPLDPANNDGSFGLGTGQVQFPALGENPLRAGVKPWQKYKPTIEVLCNNQVLPPEMSLATVRTYIWKKPEDLVLQYRIVQSRS